MRHTLSETWTSLKRNVSMTMSVVVTMWVSLSLFGVSLLMMEQVDLMKGRWYDKIEISVYLCTTLSGGTSKSGTCQPGQETSAAQRTQIQTRLEANPDVDTVYYEDKQEAFAEYQQTYKDSAILGTLTVDMMQDSFRIKLVDPQNYMGVVTEAQTLPGVQSVQDLRQVLDPLFSVLNALRWGTLGLAALLLIAAALQIGNTIRLTAFTRRREIGIMRLVGASNGYIMLPFLLESLVAGIIGAVTACGTLALAVKFLVIDRAQVSITSLAWIGWHEVLTAMLVVGIVGVVLAIIPTLIATRRYLRV
ncbi:MAG: permease-like cell division protein FtsX [Propionibacteriaceae bacterium]|nr:permease-like cell division protein FtsX [Propionibacteriaceae bacterium]